MKNLLKDQAAGRVDPGLILFRFSLCAGMLKSDSMPEGAWSRWKNQRWCFRSGKPNQTEFRRRIASEGDLVLFAGFG